MSRVTLNGDNQSQFEQGHIFYLIRIVLKYTINLNFAIVKPVFFYHLFFYANSASVDLTLGIEPK